MRVRLKADHWASIACSVLLGAACQESARVGARVESPDTAAPPPPAASLPASAARDSAGAPPGPAERQPSASRPRPASKHRDDASAQDRRPSRGKRREWTRSPRLVLPGNLVYRTGRAELAETPENEAVLQQLQRFLEQRPEITLLRIEGHTDAVGDPQANLELSGQRALAVKRALSARGVAPARLLAVGFGETQPIANNRSAAGRAQNRRTEFHIAELSGNPTGGQGPLAGGTEFK